MAQEKATSFKGTKHLEAGGLRLTFSRQPVTVNQYYFYVQDAVWGPAFLKVSSYLPYPARVCLNGHEWAKQQLRQAVILVTASALSYYPRQGDDGDSAAGAAACREPAERCKAGTQRLAEIPPEPRPETAPRVGVDGAGIAPR